MANKYEKIVTPVFRVSYPSVFEPSAMEGNTDKKYSVTMLIPKTENIDALKALVIKARDDKWPDPAKRPKNLRSPIRDGDLEKPDVDGYKGCWFITARNKSRPGLVDQKRQPILSVDDFYAGCFARASVTAFGYDKSGNRGVALSLQNVQKVKDGDPFSGRGKAEDDFGDVPVDTAGAATAASTDDFI